MMDLKNKLLTIVFVALYTPLFFNWFIYLIQSNFEVLVDMETELLIKGFVIGFSGYLICNRLKFPYFVPYGWIGALIGFNFTNYFLIPLMTPYTSLLGLGLGDTISMEFQFFKTVVVGSLFYAIGKSLGLILSEGEVRE
jgi:hypothetical protein